MFTSSQFFRLVPVVFSFAAFLLGMLALFAGNRPGVLEGYDIITVYTTHLGKNVDNKVASKTLIPTRTTDGDCDGVGSLLGQACSSMNSAAANALPPPPPPVDNGGRDGNDNNSGSNNITDGVTEKPHTRDFYSLYTLSICEGEFTADGSRMPQCHPYFSEGTSTIPALLGTTATPHTTVAHADGNIALTNSGLTYSLESALNGLDTLLKAVAVLWSLGIGFTGITFFTSIPAVSLSSDDPDPRYKYKWAVWMNLIFTGTAMFFLILGGMVAAAGAKAAEGNVNGLGADIGVSAVAGTNWIVLAWAGVALLAVALVYWTARTVKLRRDKKRDEEEAREAKDAETAGNRARAAELEKEMDILRRRMGRPPTGSQQGPPPRQSGPPLEYYRPPSPERH